MDEASPIVWDGERPVSRRFGDVYFSREDGLAESRAVFLEGCGLPEAWCGRARFTVCELGFGTGLNIAALMSLWSSKRPPGGRLSIFSVESDPPPKAEAARALGAWPEIAGVSARLLSGWPRQARGFHRAVWDDLGVTLDVAVLPVEAALAAWCGQADAWFLDGFAPATNPEMWSPSVLELVAARSAPGARAATYTVAGAVRRGLEAAGFLLERRPGFGRKRERLEARLPGVPAPSPRPPTVAIIGAGIAGAALARAFAAQGLAARVFSDPSIPAASDAPAALVAPRLDAGLGPVAELSAQAVHRALDLYEATPGAVIARGALQLEVTPKDPGRFARIAHADLFEPGAARLSESTDGSTVGGLRLDAAGVVDPTRVSSVWAPDVTAEKVHALERGDRGWRLLGANGGILAEAEVVVLAAGTACAGLVPALPLRPVRGQASVAEIAPPALANVFGGYAIPSRTGLMFGATHDRDDSDLEVRQSDHERNLAALRAALPELAARLEPETLGAYVGIRATTPDFLPLAGAVSLDAPGLFVLAGLGSRGFTLAPLLAEHVVALALDIPSPLPLALAEIVHPERFERRRARRNVASSRRHAEVA